MDNYLVESFLERLGRTEPRELHLSKAYREGFYAAVKMCGEAAKEFLTFAKEYEKHHVYDIYCEFDSVKEWADWFSGADLHLTGEQFEKTTEKDWKSWLKKEPAYYLRSDGAVIEHDWQNTEWWDKYYPGWDKNKDRSSYFKG